MRIHLHIEHILVEAGLTVDLPALEQAIGATLAEQRGASIPGDGTTIDRLRDTAPARVVGARSVGEVAGAQLGGLVHRHLFSGGSHGRS